MVVIAGPQNAYLNRDRKLAPIHVPSGTISDNNPVLVSVPQGVARDIILDNTSDTVPLLFTFIDPNDHPDGENLWKTLKPGSVFQSYCNFRNFWLMGNGGQYEIIFNAEGSMTFGDITVSLSTADKPVSPVKNPVVYAVATSLTPATETSFAVTLVKRFTMTNRGNTRIQLAYVAGQSDTNFISIFPGSSYQEDSIDTQTLTFYIQSASPTQRLEVVTWG